MKVKICGVTHPMDAMHAGQAGADYIGINFSNYSKRSVSISQAKEIAEAAKKSGGIPVAVFVEESAEEILLCCQETAIKTVQLHGLQSRLAYEVLKSSFSIFYALAAGQDYQRHLSKNSYLLIDHGGGGSGQSFDWTSFTSPKNTWFLAGGLQPGNVREAIHLLNPYGVDVASGVEFKNSIRKDPQLVELFVKNAKEAK